jgi:hemerythrin-like domain-containing protein
VVLERFEAELAPHFAVEERALVPALREVDERELIDRLESDHAALRAFVESGAPRTGEALARFGEALERHIRFEERELFPVAERRLSPAALARIERASQGSAG